MAQTLVSTKRASVAFALSVGAGVLALIFGLVIGGGAAATALADAGDVVRYGQPIAKLILDFSMAATVGTLVFAAFALADKSALLGKALDLAAAAAIIWALSGALNFLFTYLVVSGSAISASDSFGQSLFLFATSIELGISLALNVGAAVLISVLVISFRSLTAAALIAALGIVALVPLALIGHAAGTANHSLAVNSIGVHLVAGLVGTLYIGVFGTNVGAAFGFGFDQLLKQAIGCLVVGIFAFVASWLIAQAIQKTVGFRVTSTDEIAGVDLVQHGELGYAGADPRWTWRG